MISLWVLRVKGAILISIIATTIVAIIVEAIGQFGAGGAKNPTGWGLTVPKFPDKIFDTPDFGTLGEFNLFGSFEQVGAVAAILLIFTLMLADFFDTMGTMTAIGAEAGLLDADGAPPNTRSILVVDSLAAVAGGAGGVSSNTSYIESASGVGEGARTGLASVVTGVLFLFAIFLAPLVAVIPSEAAVPALVLVGFLMMQQVKGISWDDLEIAIPAFLTIVLMPFTYSITVGIGAGFLSLRADQDRQGQDRRHPPAALGDQRAVHRLLRDQPADRPADVAATVSPGARGNCRRTGETSPTRLQIRPPASPKCRFVASIRNT